MTNEQAIRRLTYFCVIWAVLGSIKVACWIFGVDL